MEGTSVFDGLLTQCRDLVAGQLDKAIAGMLEKADAALAELSTKTQNRETQKLYLEARDAVRAQRAAMEKQFGASYLSEFKQRTKKGKKTGGGFSDFDPEASSFELSLVADDDLEETLKFNEMAGKLRRICEDELNALDQRVGVLLGDADLQSEGNPLGPQAICDAYKKTCRKLLESVPVRGVFLKLFDDHVLDEVRSIYKSVNDLLVQNAILPKIRYGVTKKDEGKKGPKGAKDKDGKAEDGEDEESAGETDVFAALQKLFAGKGGAGGPGGGGPGTGVGGGPMLAGAELLGSLTKLQLDGLAALGAGGGQFAAGGAPVTGTTNVLHELKSSEVGASMGQMDAMTLDVVAMLFDQLFDDAKIPLGAKGLIGRLQIPMLKVAIADKTFFSNKAHPARLLLEKLGEIAERLPADFNTQSPLFAHLETILQELISGYQDDVEIFNIVRDQLVELMSREDQRVVQEAQAATERVIQEEALAVAKSVAQEEIRSRVLNKLPPGAVLEFLAEQWLKLMVIIHVRVGTSSDAWKNSIEAMEQLIWSVQPKDTTEERRKLATIVPPLLKRLAAGLEVAGVEHEVREFFFPELMKAHTKIMSAPLKGKDGAGAAPAAPAPAAALDFTAKLTVKNPYGGGEVQVGALDLDFSADPDSTPAAPVRDTGSVTDPDRLKQGDWVEFLQVVDDKEQRRPARLIFITPRKTRFIFSDRGEKEYIECTRAEIARRLRTGEAVYMEEEPEVPFFERIMGGVLGKMRGAAAAAA
ncbi:MAG TPA: DUF1631 family protein [Burkholderiales bacterium]|nr:DUF1631 family protein [Burkholderiales bacterium]